MGDGFDGGFPHLGSFAFCNWRKILWLRRMLRSGAAECIRVKNAKCAL